MGLPKKLLTRVQTIAVEFIESKDEDAALEAVRSAIMVSKPSDRTQSVRFSQIKKYFRENTPANPEFLAQIKPADELTKKLIEINAKTRDSAKVVEIPLETINKLKALKTSTDPLTLAIYLLFASGRRSAELINAKFSQSDKKGMVNINGLVKTRGKDMTGSFVPIGTPSNFLKLIRKFQASKPNPGTFNRLVGIRLKRLLGPDWHPHNLRGAYATYLFKHHNPKGLKINTFLQQALNHSSVISSLSYTGYSIGDKVKPIVADQKNKTTD